MTGADCLLEAKIDEAAALRREVQRCHAILRALLADPQSIWAVEAARKAVR